MEVITLGNCFVAAPKIHNLSEDIFSGKVFVFRQKIRNYQLEKNSSNALLF